MNLKGFFAAFICLIMVSCSGHAVTKVPEVPVPVPTIVVPPPVVLTRQDLPQGWKEAKSEGWSFAVPGNWIEHPKLDEGLDAVYTSPDGTLIVAFASEDAKDLVSYCKAFMNGMNNDGGKFLSGKKGTINGNNAVLLMFKIDQIIASNLIIVSGNKAYNLGCAGPADTFQENFPMCGEIAKTLKITK